MYSNLSYERMNSSFSLNFNRVSAMYILAYSSVIIQIDIYLCVDTYMCVYGFPSTTDSNYDPHGVYIIAFYF